MNALHSNKNTGIILIFSAHLYLLSGGIEFYEYLHTLLYSARAWDIDTNLQDVYGVDCVPETSLLAK